MTAPPSDASGWMFLRLKWVMVKKKNNNEVHLGRSGGDFVIKHILNLH